jgi:hypothetical protein
MRRNVFWKSIARQFKGNKKNSFRMSIVSNSTTAWSYEIRYADVVVLSVIASLVAIIALLTSIWVLYHICISRPRSVEEDDSGRFLGLILRRTTPWSRSSRGDAIDLSNTSRSESSTTTEAEEVSEEFVNSETSTEPIEVHDIEGIDTYSDLV